MKFTRALIVPFAASLLLAACGPQNYTSRAEPTEPKLSQEILEKSLALGTQFLLANQTETGNFNYEYNLETEEISIEDNAVRQAGALWGLTLINLYAPSAELNNAIEKSLAFFKENSILIDEKRCVTYPDGSENGKTGTQALVTLALVDYLRSPNAINKEAHKSTLDGALKCLLALRQDDGLFYSSYEESDPKDLAEGYGDPSPYFDGEALLAIAKAAKYADHEEYLEIAEESAKAMHEQHVQKALSTDPDSDETKGFYQWGSMAFYELFTAENTSRRLKKDYAVWTLELTDWMLDIHNVLSRSKNTAYAFEGLIHGYELARLTNNESAQEKLASAIDSGLFKLTNWQLTPEATQNPLAIGGIRNEANGQTLRIDVAQHQMHAVVLALSLLN